MAKRRPRRATGCAPCTSTPTRPACRGSTCPPAESTRSSAPSRLAAGGRKPFDRSRASALPWLYGIGSNLLLKHRRGEARRLRASARMAAADEAVDRRASAAARDAHLLFPRVADAIESLPDGEREALLLFAWEELSYQSVAEALELPIGTVRSRLNRARARLRELIEPDGKDKVKSR